MLSNAMVMPTLPAVDLKRARAFYEGKLGLKVTMEDPSPGIVLECGKGTIMYVYQRAATKADHTAASFLVGDIEAEVKELTGKGVKFQEYDLPGIKTVNGIATIDRIKSAWFKDTEGNILAVTQLPK